MRSVLPPGQAGLGDQPDRNQVTVSVHHCRACQHYFRAQPPFLRPDATYTNRVVAKAVASVFRDGMAFTRVAQRPTPGTRFLGAAQRAHGAALVPRLHG